MTMEINTLTGIYVLDVPVINNSTGIEELAHILVETTQSGGVISYSVIGSVSGSYSASGSETISVSGYTVPDPSVHSYIFYMLDGNSYTSYVKSDGGEEVTSIFTLFNSGQSMHMEVTYIGRSETFDIFISEYLDYTPISSQTPISTVNPHLDSEPEPPAILTTVSGDVYHLDAVHVAYPDKIQSQIDTFLIRFEDQRAEYYKNGKVIEYNETQN